MRTEVKKKFVKLRVTKEEHRFLNDLAKERNTHLAKLLRKLLNENLLVGHTDDAKQREP
jgi:hypothetical protein